MILPFNPHHLPPIQQIDPKLILYLNFILALTVIKPHITRKTKDYNTTHFNTLTL